MPDWWRDAVGYEVYVRSFADADGDGVGDLPGIRAKLPYLQRLGIDAIWITPFYPSPGADHGYDVADPRDVDPLFGTLDDVDALVAEAHQRGIRVLVDIVPNHTSDRHPWFRAALTSRDDPHRDRYVFRDPAPDGGPPNNWLSVFGGPAWTLHEPTGQYYLHLFAPEQPDLNWRHPAVVEDAERTLRFWFDRGVDGFRIDVAHSLFKDADLRDNPLREDATEDATPFRQMEQRHTFDQDDVHDVYRSWRRIADAYGERVLLGEVFLYEPERVARYVRADELHLSFNFLLMVQPWSATAFRDAIARTLDGLGRVGATPTWVLSSHDVIRHRTRLGGPAERARAAALLLLALPGTVFLYQGEELGLPEVDVPDAARQDPIFARTRGAQKGRDGCRVPIPWERDAPRFGFTTGTPWLPCPPGWGDHAAGSQEDNADSMLALYRRTIAARRRLSGGLAWRDAPDGCLVFQRGDVVCAVNMGDRARTLDAVGEVVVASDQRVGVGEGGLHLPPDTAAWVTV